MKHLPACLCFLLLSAPAAFAQINNSVIDPTASPMDPSGNQPLQHHKHGKFGQALHQLPKEKSDMVRLAADHAKQQNHPLVERLRQLHTETIALLEAPSLDIAALRAKQNEERKLRIQMMTNTDESFNSYAEKLSPDERRSVLAAIEPKGGSDKSATAPKKQE